MEREAWDNRRDASIPDSLSLDCRPEMELELGSQFCSGKLLIAEPKRGVGGRSTTVGQPSSSQLRPESTGAAKLFVTILGFACQNLGPWL